MPETNSSSNTQPGAHSDADVDIDPTDTPAAPGDAAQGTAAGVAASSMEGRPEPPISELQDVPPEEWSYWTAQAWAGCGVVFALLLAMFLPLVLSAIIGDTTGKLIGFGISGFIGLLSVAVISRLTYRKRQERRETMRMALAERPRAPRDTPDDRHA